MENKEEKPLVKKGLWKPEEDLILKTYVETHGEGNWTAVSAKSGLKRGGKSCRLRWKNYLRPNIKRGGMSQEEEDLIIRMHKLIGNRWSLIAGRLPGRTDNEVKNYWNTHLNKRCCDRKRKTMDSSNEEHSSDDKNKTKTKRSHQPCASPTVCCTNPQETNTQELEGKRQEKAERAEERTITCTWAQDDAQGMNYYIQPPPMVDTNNNATFVFDDDPFMAYLDPFVLFESFGYTGGETHSLLGMMQ